MTRRRLLGTKDGIWMEAWFSYLLLHDKHCHVLASPLASSTYLLKPLWEWNRKDCQVESCVYSWVGVIFKFAHFGDGVSRLSFCKESIGIGFSYILQYMRNIPCFPPPLLKIHILCGVGECRLNVSFLKVYFTSDILVFNGSLHFKFVESVVKILSLLKSTARWKLQV